MLSVDPINKHLDSRSCSMITPAALVLRNRLEDAVLMVTRNHHDDDQWCRGQWSLATEMRAEDPSWEPRERDNLMTACTHDYTSSQLFN